MSAHGGLFDVAGRTVLITGASRGIGRELALAFGRGGATVAVSFANSAAQAAEVVAEIEADGGTAAAFQADVGSPPQVYRMVDEVLDRFGVVDVLVNNAGVSDRRPTVEVDHAAWRAVLDVDLDGAYHCARAVARGSMLERGSGAIVNVSSISGLIAQPRIPQASYHAAKGGLVMLTRGLAAEWASAGVRVNCLCPGFAMTDIVAEDFPVGSEAYKAVVAQTPMPRFAELWELVGPVLFLASRASSYMTGQCLVVDGGRTVW